MFRIFSEFFHFTVERSRSEAAIFVKGDDHGAEVVLNNFRLIQTLHPTELKHKQRYDGGSCNLDQDIKMVPHNLKLPVPQKQLPVDAAAVTMKQGGTSELPEPLNNKLQLYDNRMGRGFSAAQSDIILRGVRGRGDFLSCRSETGCRRFVLASL